MSKVLLNSGPGFGSMVGKYRNILVESGARARGKGYTGEKVCCASRGREKSGAQEELVQSGG